MLAKSRHIRAVVFDLDDTLFLERNYVRSGFVAVGEYLSDQTCRRAVFERWMWRRFVSGRRDGIFDALDDRFSLGLGRKGIGEIVSVYRRHRPDIRPCRGVEAMLSRLRSLRLKLGLLSDGFMPAQRLKLEAVGLEKHFHKVIFTEQMGRSAWKPSPRGFESIRRALSVPHAECVYVADNPAKDFLAPNGLGWLTIQWRRVGQVHADKPAPQDGRPKRIVRSGPELLRLLRRSM